MQMGQTGDRIADLQSLFTSTSRNKHLDVSVKKFHFLFTSLDAVPPSGLTVETNGFSPLDTRWRPSHPDLRAVPHNTATPPALSDAIEAHCQRSAPGQGGVAVF
ncbi:unnamed protein product [Pleuronectes platessa]|uniref:Uncharacterized protein n=1 Tax=Pleuronectes platessa TaxID=8262 RepID=A0A9N7V859_PLEPL|nr:unnamed protein product [Pleuronectes platessa]